MSDGLVGALHHERQRQITGLTIHYQLAAKGDEARARKLVQQLHRAALDLPFERVSRIVDYRTDRYGANNPARRATSFQGHE